MLRFSNTRGRALCIEIYYKKLGQDFFDVQCKAIYLDNKYFAAKNEVLSAEKQNMNQLMHKGAKRQSN